MAEMSFGLGDDIDGLRDTARGIAQSAGPPSIATEVDLTNASTHHLWREMGELGLLGITVPEESMGPAWAISAHCVAATSRR